MMKRLIGILLTLLVALDAAALTIRIPESVSVSGSRIRLGDVAEIDGTESEVAALSSLDLGRAPSPGSRYRMVGSRIQRRIGEKAPSATLEIPERIEVVTPFSSVSEELLQAEVAASIFDRVDEKKFVLADFRLLGRNRFPEGSLELGEPALSITKSRVRGKVAVFSNGKPAGHLRITARLDREVPAVVPMRTVEAGTVLSRSDLVVRILPESEVPEDAVQNLEDAIGKRVVRRLRAERPVSRKKIAAPRVVARGDRVRLVARSGNLTVTSEGEVLENGGTGDRIRVENLSSGKQVVARVKNSRTVEVFF